MTPRLRRIGSADELAILRPVILEYFRFISEELVRHHDVDLDPESPVDAMFDNPARFLPPIGQTLFAEDEGGIIGTVALKPLDPNRVEIKRLYVRPSAQRRGLGKLLLKEAKNIARDMGAGEMYLDTLRSLSAAIAMYRADGFEETALYPGAEIGEHPDILPHAIFMKRAL